MTGNEPARCPSSRVLVGVCAGLGGAAVLLWGGSVAVWHRGVPAGRVVGEVTGAQVAPSLGGVAVLALAGIAAVVATGGVLRRLVGVLLALAGAAVAAVAVSAVLVPPSGTDPTGAPLLGVAGAVALLVVALFVLVREPRLARLGARYAGRGTPRVEVDPDRAAWRDLDAGRDPTADRRGGRGDHPS